MSEDVTSPTPLSTTTTFWGSEATIASRLPALLALRIKGISSSLRRLRSKAPLGFGGSITASFASRATEVPTGGVPVNPKTFAGSPGNTCLIDFPLSSNKALTLHSFSSAKIVSPTLIVPFLTTTVATGPILSLPDSMTTASSPPAGSLLSSATSDIKTSISTTSVRPIFVFAETEMNGTCPPRPSKNTPSFSSCPLSASAFTPTMSALVPATIKGRFAALIIASASRVWG